MVQGGYEGKVCLFDEFQQKYTYVSNKYNLNRWKMEEKMSKIFERLTRTK